MHVVPLSSIHWNKYVGKAYYRSVHRISSVLLPEQELRTDLFNVKAHAHPHLLQSNAGLFVLMKHQVVINVACVSILMDFEL